MKRFVMDYNAARRYYDEMTFDRASEFGPAYIVTNENLKKSLNLFRGKKDNVLTVAASGDQALRYALAGARNIDTFDQTFCAKVIQDFKVAALGCLTREEYIYMLGEFFKFGGVMYDQDVLRIMNAMPRDSVKFMREMEDYRIFGRGVPPRESRFIPTLDEYQQLAETVTAPFNFIWSDIADLHMRVSKKYDVINVSNIFDWIGAGRIEPVLKNLFPCLRAGGYILASTFNDTGVVRKKFMDVSRALGDKASVEWDFSALREDVFALRRAR